MADKVLIKEIKVPQSSLVAGTQYHLHIPAGSNFAAACYDGMSSPIEVECSRIFNVQTTIGPSTDGSGIIGYINPQYGVHVGDQDYVLGSSAPADFDCDFIFSHFHTGTPSSAFFAYVTINRSVVLTKDSKVLVK